MNIYLEKIAEQVSKKDLPYRSRVEVLILRGGKVLVTKNKNKDTGEVWAGLPGGGLDGDSASVACKKETLEEVGIKIKNPASLGITYKQEGGLSKKDNRHLKFRGSDTEWFVADFDKVDRTHLGRDGDSRQYAWQGPLEALQGFKEGKVMSTPRVSALKALIASKRV